MSAVVDIITLLSLFDVVIFLVGAMLIISSRIEMDLDIYLYRQGYKYLSVFVFDVTVLSHIFFIFNNGSISHFFLLLC